MLFWNFAKMVQAQEYLIKGINFFKIGQCEDDIKVPFPVVHFVLIREVTQMQIISSEAI